MTRAMPIRDHMEGFEKEAMFRRFFVDVAEACPDLRWPDLENAIASVAPTYIAALGKRRLCFRKLRYIGCTGNPEEPPADHEFFKLGQFYVGEFFNGATYTITDYYDPIDGYTDRPIGCAYFEWLDWVEEDLAWLPVEWRKWIDAIEPSLTSFNELNGIFG